MASQTSGGEETVTVLLSPRRLPDGAIAFDLRVPLGGVAGRILATDPEYPAAAIAIAAAPGAPTLEVSSKRVRELVLRSWR